MVESLGDTSRERTMKSFRKLIPPPRKSIKESTSRILGVFLDVGRLSIFLNILGVSGIGFFPSKTTQILLLFESNIRVH
jgi:hypothetical protein